LGEAVQWSNASGDVSTATAFRLDGLLDPRVEFLVLGHP
jgi:hypothetical protein